MLYALLFAQAVDSAAIARRDYRDAIADLHQGDTTAAQLKLQHAARAYPVQPAYPIAHASIAARRGDTAAVAESLSTIADYGLTHDIQADADFAGVRTSPSLQAIEGRLLENRTSRNESQPAFTIPDSTFFLEGLAHDTSTGNWYLPSVRHGSILLRRKDGTWQNFVPEQACSAMAAVVEAKTNKLWVVRAPVPQNEHGANCKHSSLEAYDFRNGRLLDSFAPPDTNAHAFGDIAASRAGDIFISDTRASAVYVLRRGTRALQLLSNDRFLRSPQGMAVTPDGATMIVADYSHGLARVDARTGTTSEIARPPFASLVGIDGVALVGRALIAVQNGVVPARLLRLALSSDWNRVERVDVLDRIVGGEPTLGLIAGESFYFVANSHWAFYNDDGSRRRDAQLPHQQVRRIRVTGTLETSH